MDDRLRIVANKGEIQSVESQYIGEATYQEIRDSVEKKKKMYSLNAKKYNKTIVECDPKYRMVRLGDCCEFLKKSKRKASYGQQTGKYNFYTSSDSIKKCDTADYNTKCIMIGTGGNSCIHIDTTFSCSADMLLLKPTINIDYVYNALKISWDR